jgi:spoIIIJ-associated protein
VDQDDDEQESNNMSDTELAQQGEVVRGFLLDLVDAFGFDAEVTATPAEEGAVELAVAGGDLGLMIGPKGATLQAIQELSRSVLQRQLPGESHARIRVDVSGYRARRREALEAFVRTVAEDVRASGTQKALEPMSPPDRKIVHDTVNDLDGVHTISEGEDHRRRVVILPDA